LYLQLALSQLPFELHALYLHLLQQPWDDPYYPRTYPHLLKWKFRHMNSVDFKLAAMPGQQPRLLLNCATRRKHGNTDINHLSLQGERVVYDRESSCALHVEYREEQNSRMFRVQ
jgi:hypothetical protein